MARPRLRMHICCNIMMSSIWLTCDSEPEVDGEHATTMPACLCLVALIPRSMHISLPASLLHCMADGSRRRGQSTHATAPLRSFECFEWKTGLSIAAARASSLLPASLTLAGACIASNDGGKWSGGRWVGWGTFTRAGKK